MSTKLAQLLTTPASFFIGLIQLFCVLCSAQYSAPSYSQNQQPQSFFGNDGQILQRRVGNFPSSPYNSGGQQNYMASPSNNGRFFANDGQVLNQRRTAAYGPSLYSRNNYGNGDNVYGAIDKVAAPVPYYGATTRPYEQPITYYGKPIPLPSFKNTSPAQSTGNAWGGYQPGFYRPVWDDDYTAVVQNLGSTYATLATSRDIYVPRAPPPVYGDLGALSQHPFISELVVRDVLKGTALGDFKLIETTTAAPSTAAPVNASDASVRSEGPSTQSPLTGPALPLSSDTPVPAPSSASPSATVVVSGSETPDCSFTTNDPSACKSGSGSSQQSATQTLTTIIVGNSNQQQQQSNEGGAPVPREMTIATVQPSPPSSTIISSQQQQSESAAPVQSQQGTAASSQLEPLDQPPVHPNYPGNNNNDNNNNKLQQAYSRTADASPVGGVATSGRALLPPLFQKMSSDSKVSFASSPQMNVIHIGSDSSLNMTELLFVLSSAQAAGQLNNVNEPTLTIVKQRGPISSVMSVPTSLLKTMTPFNLMHFDDNQSTTPTPTPTPAVEETSTPTSSSMNQQQSQEQSLFALSGDVSTTTTVQPPEDQTVTNIDSSISPNTNTNDDTAAAAAATNEAIQRQTTDWLLNQPVRHPAYPYKDGGASNNSPLTTTVQERMLLPVIKPPASTTAEASTTSTAGVLSTTTLAPTNGDEHIRHPTFPGAGVRFIEPDTQLNARVNLPFGSSTDFASPEEVVTTIDNIKSSNSLETTTESSLITSTTTTANSYQFSIENETIARNPTTEGSNTMRFGEEAAQIDSDQTNNAVRTLLDSMVNGSQKRRKPDEDDESNTTKWQKIMPSYENNIAKMRRRSSGKVKLLTFDDFLKPLIAIRANKPDMTDNVR